VPALRHGDDASVERLGVRAQHGHVDLCAAMSQVRRRRYAAHTVTSSKVS
jgi:hypothetical protein